VVPDGREQVIASLEGGILRELHVREGMQVEAGQELALLDPTRFEAQQAEGQAKRLSLQGTLARLQAEAGGRPLRFPPAVAGVPRTSLKARPPFAPACGCSRGGGVPTAAASALLRRELDVAEACPKGLMSEVEVIRLRARSTT
jgi:membrane fusion protein, adhesin transport system